MSDGRSDDECAVFLEIVGAPGRERGDEHELWLVRQITVESSLVHDTGRVEVQDLPGY